MSEMLLEMKDISKSFNNNQVLKNVSFDLRPGEIHALLGENGAGKSTLLNILTGTIRADSGTILLHGTRTEIRNLAAARDAGIIRVHQELQVVPQMTVAQNIFLGSEPKTKLGLLNYEEMYRRGDEILRTLDADFSSRDVLGSLSTAQMQMVEISKALLKNFVVLALDEPTSSLTNNEIEKLLSTVMQLKENGKGIIYVSHRLDEIFRIADRATVLRDGTSIGTVNVKEISRPELIRMMVGRDIAEQRFNETSRAADEEVLQVENLSGTGFQDVSFSLRKGEVLGFAGLVGAGRTEVMRALFGIDPAKAGTVRVHGREVVIRRPQDAEKNGIMLIPEDRKYQGMVGILANKDNIAMSSLPKYKKGGFLNHRRIREDAGKFTEILKISPPDVEMPTGQLSGGNQQKVVLAKAINTEPEIFIFDEPTRGIDINVKFEIYKLIRDFAAQGKAVIMISSELPEVISLSDRVIVMYEGAVTGELASSELTEESIMTLAMGGSQSGKSQDA